MFCCGKISEKRREKNIDLIITEILEEENVKNNEEVKILLVGTGESGKSTFFRQLKLQFVGTSIKDREMFRPVVLSNLLMCIKVMYHVMIYNDFPFITEDSRKAGEFLNSCDSLFYTSDKVFLNSKGSTKLQKEEPKNEIDQELEYLKAVEKLNSHNIDDELYIIKHGQKIIPEKSETIINIAEKCRGIGETADQKKENSNSEIDKKEESSEEFFMQEEESETACLLGKQNLIESTNKEKYEKKKTIKDCALASVKPGQSQIFNPNDINNINKKGKSKSESLDEDSGHKEGYKTITINTYQSKNNTLVNVDLDNLPQSEIKITNEFNIYCDEPEIKNDEKLAYEAIHSIIAPHPVIAEKEKNKQLRSPQSYVESNGEIIEEKLLKASGFSFNSKHCIGVSSGIKSLLIEKSVAMAVKTFIDDTNIQDVLSQAYMFPTEMPLPESAVYFLNPIVANRLIGASALLLADVEKDDGTGSEIVSSSYVLSEEIFPDDIIRSRIRTVGMNELKFTFKSVPFRIIDVGGQKGERKKWLKVFQESAIKCILFFVSLIDYDIKTEEDSIIRLRDSLYFFDTTINSPMFQNMSVVLFLNKWDLFEQRVKAKSIKQCFPEYKGSDTFDESASYIKKRFMAVDRTKNRLKSAYFTTMTDNTKIKVLFNTVKEFIISESLQEIGL